MERVSFSSTRRGAAAVALALALTGCGSSFPTPFPVVGTPVPTSAPTAAPTTTPTATPAPAVTATPTAAPTPTVAVTTSPAAAPTPTFAASPTSAAVACKGTTPDLKALFVEAASNLSFDVYCASVLPSSWWMQSASYVLPDGGYLQADYKNSGGATFEVREGRWCPPTKVCIAPGATVGPASFGGLGGTLYLNITTYTLQVGTYAKPAYLMVGNGMSQAQFVAWAAAMVKVPKS
jgi:hypothetical protein